MEQTFKNIRNKHREQVFCFLKQTVQKTLHDFLNNFSTIGFPKQRIKCFLKQDFYNNQNAHKLFIFFLVSIACYFNFSCHTCDVVPKSMLQAFRDSHETRRV